jgi:D-arginine dehydrogenase
MAEKMVDRISYDIVIVGAGIAGASVAAALGDGVKVALLEQEQQPGYHSTGRSAAIYSPTYGPTPIRALTRASLGHFLGDDVDEPKSYLTPIDAAFIARADQSGSFDALCSELTGIMNWREIAAEEIQSRITFLREGYASKAILDSGTSEIDVALLHQRFLKVFSQNGGTLLNSTEVLELKKQKNGWLVKTNQGEFVTKIIVNAAGAWADHVGSLAGAECIGLTPKRRTALIVEPPRVADLNRTPLVIDIDEQFYLKPYGSKFLISPANEDPVQPCDVQTEEMDIAICVDRIQRAFDIEIRRIEHSWAGLRSFVADKCPVVGFSSKVDDFYWLAGQGGYGIQSSPALGMLAASEILGAKMPVAILDSGLDLGSIRPGRENLLSARKL